MMEGRETTRRLGGVVSPSPSPPSPAGVGATTRIALSKAKRIFDIRADRGNPPVLTSAEQAAVSALTTERDVIKYMTPKISLLLPQSPSGDRCPRIYLNSEVLPFLQHETTTGVSSTAAKPDGWGGFAPFAELRAAIEGQGMGPAFIYGLLPRYELQLEGLVTMIGEAKFPRILTDTDFDLEAGLK